MNPEQTNITENEGNVSPAEEIVTPAINSPVTNDEPPKKNRKWKKIVVIAVFIVIAIPFLGYLLLVISFSGGISGVISDLKSAPNPESSNLVSKRNAARNSINSSFTELDSKIGFTSYAVATHDRCYEGQNNWKVHDGYAHRCTYRVTKFYGFNGDFRQKIINFEQQIMNSGWKPAYSSGFPIKEIMEQYYDKYYGPDKTTPRNFPEGYLVSSLPTPTSGYLKDKNVLEVEYAEKATEDLFQIEYAQNVSRDTLIETYDKKDFQDINLIFQKITQEDKFILVISIQEDYFEN